MPERKKIDWYKRPEIYGLSFGALGFGIMIWYFFMLIPNHLNINYELSIDKSAQIGDFIGGVVATLFSIAAFLLLYETLITQKQEIKENKGILLKQSFETNLFQMINMHNDFVKEFDIHADVNDPEGKMKSGSIITEGRDSFNFVYSQYMKNNMINSRIGDKDYIKNEIFDIMLKDWSDDLNHYFKHACEIVKYITTSVFTGEKQQYMTLFASGLSDSEKALYYYYVVFYTDETFRNNMIEYNFFADMPNEKLISENHKKWLYE